MTTAHVVVTLVAALVPTVTGLAKVLAAPPMRERASHLGFTVSTFRGLGALELAGVAGLVTGLWVPLVGAAAAAGLVAMMVGAVVCHRRSGDPVSQVVPAVVVGALAATALVLMVWPA